MFVGKPPGNYDRLLDFSRAVTGTLFFAPSATFLDDVQAAPATAENEPQQPASTATDRSLGIGSLRKETP
jgi:putative iron-dependent peroxidase